MKNVKAVIFDLDGVLCSTDRYHFAAWKQLADRLGIYFDYSINDRLRGVSRMDSLDILLGDYRDNYSYEEKLLMADSKNETYKEMLNAMSNEDLSSSVYQTLVNLRERGYKLAVGSSSKNARLILKRLGLEDFFDAIADGTQIKNSKPDPEVFLKAAELLDVTPKDTVVVEDAQSGIAAARRGGFYAIGINVDGDDSISEFEELEKILL